MQYHELPVTAAQHSGIHYAHEIVFVMREAREEELQEFLTHNLGLKRSAWRQRRAGIAGLSASYRQPLWTYVLRFANKDHAMRFKLGWQECEKLEPSGFINWQKFRTTGAQIRILPDNQSTPFYYTKKPK